jgi:hypothetical protein
VSVSALAIYILFAAIFGFRLFNSPHGLR